MNIPRNQRKCRGFTLIELLVTIGIIGLLMSILLPAIGRARRQAKLTACASNLHQICIAVNTYAATHDGEFPDLTTPGTGGNLWDISHFFYNELVSQGVRLSSFTCPAAQEDLAGQQDVNVYSTFNIVQYNVWIARLNGADIIPPAPDYAGTRFQIAQPRPINAFAGPANQNDLAAIKNPIISDIVASGTNVTPPATADASVGGNPYQMAIVSNHMDGKRMLGVNQGFADGHVEYHSPEQIHPYYLGNWWNWR